MERQTRDSNKGEDSEAMSCEISPSDESKIPVQARIRLGAAGGDCGELVESSEVVGGGGGTSVMRTDPAWTASSETSMLLR